MSFERKPSQRYPRRAKLNSSKASSTTLNNIDPTPHQPIIVHNIVNNNPDSILENTALPDFNRQSNISLNKKEEPPVILPNPNHHVFNNHKLPTEKQIELSCNETDENTRGKGVIVDVHRTNDEEGSQPGYKNKQHVPNNVIPININNLRFDLDDQTNRNVSGFPPHSVASKRISSSSSGGYSATDEVDYLKWVSETKGQLKHHNNKKIVFATNVNSTDKQEAAANKSLNSSSSGVSSVESCPVGVMELDTKREKMSQHCQSSSTKKRTPSLNSSSSGHGSPEDSVMTANDRSSENHNDTMNCDPVTEENKRMSPISATSRINSSSPDSGYEHLSSSGN